MRRNLAILVAIVLVGVIVFLIARDPVDAEARCRDLHRRDVVTSEDVREAEDLGCPLT